MAFLPPVPNCGKSGETPYGYQINAGATGGNSLIPVLFFELFNGLEGS